MCTHFKSICHWLFILHMLYPLGIPYVMCYLLIEGWKEVWLSTSLQTCVFESFEIGSMLLEWMEKFRYWHPLDKEHMNCQMNCQKGNVCVLRLEQHLCARSKCYAIDVNRGSGCYSSCYRKNHVFPDICSLFLFFILRKGYVSRNDGTWISVLLKSRPSVRTSCSNWLV